VDGDAKRAALFVELSIVLWHRERIGTLYYREIGADSSLRARESLQMRRRLLTVGHSYVIGVNRRLAHEMARVGRDTWDVTCVAPRRYRADLGWETFVPQSDEPCRSLAVGAHLTRSPHLFAFGLDLKPVLAEAWDAIYVWEEPYIVSGWQLARWSPPGAVFTFLTLQNIRKRYPPPFSWFERETLHRADGWLYCGHSVYEAQRDKPGYLERPSRLGPLGVDVELFQPDPEAGRRAREELGWREPGPPVVGFVGRFVPEKGLRLLMRALDAVKAPFRALFIGGGPLEPELRAWMKDKADAVRIVTLPHHRVPPYLNALDVLCAPSKTARHWREQFGRMLVEAGACRIPVIGSDSGEIPYVVGDAGLVVGEDDERGWTSAIETLLSNPEKRRELGAAGFDRAHQSYAWPVVARAYLGFFEELLDVRATRRTPR
jgi:glycosyltransferase involved in cell wall biosynthesis